MDSDHGYRIVMNGVSMKYRMALEHRMAFWRALMIALSEPTKLRWSGPWIQMVLMAPFFVHYQGLGNGQNLNIGLFARLWPLHILRWTAQLVLTITLRDHCKRKYKVFKTDSVPIKCALHIELNDWTDRTDRLRLWSTIKLHGVWSIAMDHCDSGILVYHRDSY